jgi:restriction endonuclease S subunit
VCVDQPNEKTVCTPHFFQIRIQSSTALLPTFLAWQINQTPAQGYFSRLAQGSVLRNIKKSELATLPVVIPPLETQQKIIAVDQLTKKETQLLAALVDNRRQMMNTIARQTLSTHEQHLQDI